MGRYEVEFTRVPKAHLRFAVLNRWHIDEFLGRTAGDVEIVPPSTNFAYRKLYREGGLPLLLRNLGPGRPRTSLGLDVHAVIANGLRYLSWFHVPTLQRFVERFCRQQIPLWTVRRLARMWESLLGIRLSRKRQYRNGRLDPAKELEAPPCQSSLLIDRIKERGLPEIKLHIGNPSSKPKAILSGGSLLARKVLQTYSGAIGCALANVAVRSHASPPDESSDREPPNETVQIPSYIIWSIQVYLFDRSEKSDREFELWNQFFGMHRPWIFRLPNLT